VVLLPSPLWGGGFTLPWRGRVAGAAGGVG
jgi:hypothetical protein